MSKVKENNIIISNCILYFVYSIYLIKMMLGRIEYLEKIKDFLSIIQILFLVLCILIQSSRYNYKSLLIIICTTTTSIISYYVTKDTNIIFVFLYIFAMKNVNTKELIRFDIKAKLTLLGINFLFLLFGVVENSVYYRDDGTIRNTLGFDSPNTIGMILVSIFIEFIYLKKEKIDFKYFILLAISILFLIIIFDSRSSAISLIILFISTFFAKYIKAEINFKKIICYSMLGYTILTLCFVYLYSTDNPIAIHVDDILSTRIAIANNFFQEYKVNLFGNYFKSYDYWIGYANTIDNAYIYLLLKHGILNYIIMLIFNIRLMKYFIKENDKWGIICLSIMYIYGLMEKATFILVYNLILIEIKNIVYLKSKSEGNNYE